jgi:hypothetical protein
MNTWDPDETIGAIDHVAHTGLILAEDAAIKEYLTGLTVPDKSSTVPVDVWFRYPEGERRIKFPFITIDFLAINPSFDRWQSLYNVTETDAEFRDPVTNEVESRGMYIPSVSPTLPEKEGETTGYHLDPYLMHTLMYQITVHTRSALHDRYLMSRFITDVLPPRPFWIPVAADNTWRRCELVEMQPSDTMETTESGSKRIFRKVYTINIDAEIPQSRLYEVETVRRLHADLYDKDSNQRESVEHAYDDPHVYAESVTVEPPSGT